jgi:para-nitrobenzyl esterase
LPLPQHLDAGQSPTGASAGDRLLVSARHRKRAAAWFEPLQLGPQFLLANAERDGEKYAVSLGAPSLKELSRLPASQLTGNAGGIVHAVIEPYVLPASPYEAFASAAFPRGPRSSTLRETSNILPIRAPLVAWRISLG